MILKHQWIVAGHTPLEPCHLPTLQQYWNCQSHYGKFVLNSNMHAFRYGLYMTSQAPYMDKLYSVYDPPCRLSIARGFLAILADGAIIA